MILSHKYNFIFIKTAKTAGSSIETYLSSFCGENDVITPIRRSGVDGHYPRNYKGYFNPIPDIMEALRRDYPKFSTKKVFMVFGARKRFYNHIPAVFVQSRVPNEIWNSYFKFTVERNPFEKVISHFYHNKSNNPELDFDTYMENQSYRAIINYPLYTDINGDIIVDYIIKYEKLNSELSKIFTKLGIPFNGELNKKVHGRYRKDGRSYQEFFSGEYEKYIETIERAFKKEIDMHGYTFK